MEYLIFSTFSIQRFKNAKSSFSFVPNIGYLGLMDIKIMFIYKFYTMGRQAYLLLVLYRVLAFHHKFSTQRFKVGRVNLCFCIKNWFSRSSGYQNDLYLYIYTAGGQAYVYFHFVMVF